MNRLIIVGNGFDLAHGLPTKYCDFIKDFWRNIKHKYKDDDYRSVLNINDNYSGFLNRIDIESYEDFKNAIKEYVLEYGYKYREESDKGYFRENNKKIVVVEYNNYFFKKLNEIHSLQNWVDVENVYYDLLKDCLQEIELSNHHIEIKSLNDQFEQVKNLLEKYLEREVENKFSIDVNDELFAIIDNEKIEKDEIDNFIKEFKESDGRYIRKCITEIRYGEQIQKYFSLDSINILNFNYTSLIEKYIIKAGKSNYYFNQIHGKLNSNSNPINFGFGDEMDKKYPDIEEKGDNEYLRNIKSFAYSNTNNYKALLDLIDSDKFQVYIMGHSCGLSDRTLLNTIFEHENCLSIKIFYHEFETTKINGVKDNYTEIVQNTSRHFNKKGMMREKIVNKTLCQPLPQIKLLLKENGSQ